MQAWGHYPLISTLMPLLHPGQGKQAVTSELGFDVDSCTKFKNNPEGLNCFLWNWEAKSGSLEMRAAGNGNIPFYFTFLTLFNCKELESQHNDSVLRHDTLKSG